MLSERSFSEIFEELIKARPSGMGYNSGWESALDPASMAQLMGLLPTGGVSVTTRGRHPYASFKRAGTPPPVRPAHILNETQTAAFAEIIKHSPYLPVGFTLRELKSAFRQAALITHPDRGGSGESFQSAKKSYHILEALVKNEA